MFYRIINTKRVNDQIKLDGKLRNVFTSDGHVDECSGCGSTNRLFDTTVGAFFKSCAANRSVAKPVALQANAFSAGTRFESCTFDC